MATFTGTSGNDTLKGTGKDDVFDLSQGGDDNIKGAGGDDIFSFGGAFTAKDHVNGGAGEDNLVLAGNYGAGLVLAANSLAQVEEIDLTSGFNYSLTMNDGNVAAGQTMSISATDLAANNKFTFDGSHETDGAFAISVRFAEAVLTGGAGADTFTLGDRLGSSGVGGGGGGGDILTGGGGADDFIFLSLAKTGRPHEITDLSNQDVIDLKNIDANSKVAGDQAFTLVASLSNHPGQAARSFDADTGKTSLLLDVNGDGKADYTILLDGDHHGFTHFVL